MQRILKGSGIFTLTAILVGIYCMPVMAQAPTEKKYKTNVSINVDMQSIETDGDGVDNEGWTVNAGFGFFINDMFEIGPEIGYKKMDLFDGDAVLTSWSIGARGNAHFNTGSQVTPYVGLNLAFSNAALDIGDEIDEDENTFSYGIQAGLDYFLTQNLSINPELRYVTGTYDFYGEDVDISDTIFTIGLAAHF